MELSEIENGYGVTGPALRYKCQNRKIVFEFFLPGFPQIKICDSRQFGYFF